MSGNFDFPPASGSSTDADPNSIPARFQSLRQVIHRERERQRRGWDDAAEQRQRQNNSSPLSLSTPRPSHRRIANIRSSSQSRAHLRWANHSSEGPSSSLGRRPRQHPRESHSGNHIYQRGQSHHSSGLSGRGGNSELSWAIPPALLESADVQAARWDARSFPNIDSFLADSGPTANENDVGQPRPKRRKIDFEKQETVLPEYGYYGQVASGPLKMEMVSCDGGQFREDLKGYHCPENVLRNDKSVYCTENSFCNIMLCHPGESLFTLEKITIKSPEIGYTSPVQEGLIFVAMSESGLVKSAKRYEVRYARDQVSRRSLVNAYARRLAHSRSQEGRDRPGAEGEGLTLMESLNDPGLLELYDTRRSAEQPNEPLSILDHDHTDSERELLPPGLADPCDYNANVSATITSTDPLPHEFRAPTPPPPPQIRVTTDLSEEADDTELSTPLEILMDRREREHRWLHSPASFQVSGFDPQTGEDSGNLPPLDVLWNDTTNDVTTFSQFRRENGRMPFPMRPRRTRSPSRLHLAEMTGAEEQEHVKPNAHFFIPEDKRSISVKFDPPISGRYVMLRLWSPLPLGNIDIQSVVVHGWAGPRFFPAAQPV